MRIAGGQVPIIIDADLRQGAARDANACVRDISAKDETAYKAPQMRQRGAME